MTLISENPKIDLYRVNDSLQYALLDLEEFALSRGLTDKRTIEKQAALYVVRNVLEDDKIEILYLKSGRPYLKYGSKISISHSNNRLVVLFSAYKEAGVDIEQVRDKILKVREKFLSNKELNDIKGASLEKYTLYWCVKEALYKACGISGLLFAEQLYIEPFVFLRKGGKINAGLIHPHSKKKYTLHYRLLDDYILAYTYRTLE